MLLRHTRRCGEGSRLSPGVQWPHLGVRTAPPMAMNSRAAPVLTGGWSCGRLHGQYMFTSQGPENFLELRLASGLTLEAPERACPLLSGRVVLRVIQDGRGFSVSERLSVQDA